MQASVLVVDDDAIVRAWIRVCIRGSEFRLAGEAATAATALELAARRRPTLFLVDYQLPDRLGTELIKELRENGFAGPALVITAHRSQGLNESAREAGAQGCVIKSSDPDELRRALRTVRDGGEYFDPSHPRRPALQAALSPRERDVLRLVAAGATTQAIAAELGIGETTVKTFLVRVSVKLGTHGRAQTVAVATRLGLL